MSSPTPISDQLRATGNWNTGWDSLTEHDPIWTEKFMAVGMHPMLSDVIEPKVWKFISIAVDASCAHLHAPGTRRHVRSALELGATKEDIAAVLQGISVPGLHANSLGAPILLEELAALDRRKAAQHRAA